MVKKEQDIHNLHVGHRVTDVKIADHFKHMHAGVKLVVLGSRSPINPPSPP